MKGYSLGEAAEGVVKSPYLAIIEGKKRDWTGNVEFQVVYIGPKGSPCVHPISWLGGGVLGKKGGSRRREERASADLALSRDVRDRKTIFARVKEGVVVVGRQSVDREKPPGATGQYPLHGQKNLIGVNFEGGSNARPEIPIQQISGKRGPEKETGKEGSWLRGGSSMEM